jgi:sn-glycerol 3-phosphate transport system ATP-binding protein
MESLTLQSVTKVYEGAKLQTRVLEDVSLAVKPGEFIVLVGPSGCGKSTLLRMIAGLEEITSGELHISGKNVTHTAPAERNIAMVFQDYALYPHMSVRENLSFGLKIQKVEKEESNRRVVEVAQLLSIDHLLERKPAALSGGQRQRVAIGRAIVRQPQVFLFDEPLSNLDAQLRSKTRIELAALHQRLKSTVIYVTHDQVEAMTLATRIVVLHKGRIQQVGTPLELYHKPANQFVASFIGNPSMNFWKGTLRFASSGAQFEIKGEKSQRVLQFAKELCPKTEGDYLLGIRPESLKVLALEGRESKGDVDLNLTVSLLEPHGHEAHLVGTWGHDEVLVRSANPHRLRRMMSASPGDVLPVTIDREALHWFEIQEPHNRMF